MNKIEKLVNLFNYYKTQGATSESLNKTADKIQKINIKAYSRGTSFVNRRNIVSEFEIQKWDRLKCYVKPSKQIKLFDSAFGSGRDLIIAKDEGYDVYGCELSNYLYNDFLKQSLFDKRNLIKSDLRFISFGDETFDIVRHNASFLHMPIIGEGYTAHLCLQESYRILKPEGILYICTKEGTGFVAIDTQDGLGVRSFQLYNEQTLGDLLKECGFVAIEFNHYIRQRNRKNILWIEVYAKKIKNKKS